MKPQLILSVSSPTKRQKLSRKPTHTETLALYVTRTSRWATHTHLKPKQDAGWNAHSPSHAEQWKSKHESPPPLSASIKEENRCIWWKDTGWEGKSPVFLISIIESVLSYKHAAHTNKQTHRYVGLQYVGEVWWFHIYCLEAHMNS